jgi:hypothetical protein
VNIRLGLEAERWDVFFFMRNALDETYHIGAFASGAPIPLGTLADPRTYSAQARVRF